ncbi:hypothetical protein L1987_40366 [Smallanthus sonchifolius]|uniref:Uncharacterized protein n=1 Tax=Smallanthus sonchifolius TaxID=185202 RepID=A0ACB9GTU1_9ASTR|nr:hypothetical protein L1987_40366 [Smallanthus sonchifolius]
MSEAVNYQRIINFLHRSRLRLALSSNPYITTVNNTEVVISVDTIRTALGLGGKNDEPLSLPSILIMGCFQRMGYRGRANDTHARKEGLVGQWRSRVFYVSKVYTNNTQSSDSKSTSTSSKVFSHTDDKKNIHRLQQCQTTESYIDSCSYTLIRNLGLNIDDLNEEVHVQSPAQGEKGHVEDISTSSSDVTANDETDSEATKDFSSDHYE